MNGKVTEAAVAAAVKAYEKLSEWGDSLGNDAERECMRAALEAALPHLQPAKPEAVQLRDELRERTPVDYAIEHAGYLVTAANQMIEARNELDALVMRQDEGGDVGDDEMQAAQEAVGDASNVLRLAIHEFEKRRDRALAATGKQQVGEVQGLDALAEKLVSDWQADGRMQPHAWDYRGFAKDAMTRIIAARQPVGQEPVDWAIVANEYADAACNALDGMKCIRDGLMSAEQVIESQQSNIKRIQKMHHRDAAPPAQTVDLGHARAIEMLLTVAEAAYNLADNANDMEDCENVEHADFVALSDALDALDELPDDRPNYTMTEPAKARWALRGLIDGQT